MDGPRFSDREREVVRLVAYGLTNARIGSELGISGLTVKKHLLRVSKKSGCRDRAHLVATGFRDGWLVWGHDGRIGVRKENA
jgi:DNA-binding CsgD family transcriptional regulator